MNTISYLLTSTSERNAHVHAHKRTHAFAHVHAHKHTCLCAQLTRLVVGRVGPGLAQLLCFTYEKKMCSSLHVTLSVGGVLVMFCVVDLAIWSHARDLGLLDVQSAMHVSIAVRWRESWKRIQSGGDSPEASSFPCCKHVTHVHRWQACYSCSQMAKELEEDADWSFGRHTQSLSFSSCNVCYSYSQILRELEEEMERQRHHRPAPKGKSNLWRL